MHVLFCRRMLQRYRSICHLVDRLISAGIETSIAVHYLNKEPSVSYRQPWNVCNSSPQSLRYVAANFGIEMKHFSKLVFTTDKKKKCDYLITLDDTIRTAPFFSIPFVEPYFRTSKNKILVGNPLCEIIRKTQEVTEEIPNSVLIIHPGGGRGFVSPVRRSLSVRAVLDNNVQLLSNVMRSMLEVNLITIKTHSVPYVGCDKESILSIVPRIKQYTDGTISVEDNNLPKLISQHEFVINFGSSTVIWLLGSPKKWINVIDQAQFPGYKLHRQSRNRTKHWSDWPQNINLSSLSEVMDQYESKCVIPKSLRKIFDFHKKVYQMNANDNIMAEIDKLRIGATK